MAVAFSSLFLRLSTNSRHNSFVVILVIFPSSFFASFFESIPKLKAVKQRTPRPPLLQTSGGRACFFVHSTVTGFGLLDSEVLPVAFDWPFFTVTPKWHYNFVHRRKDGPRWMTFFVHKIPAVYGIVLKVVLLNEESSAGDNVGVLQWLFLEFVVFILKLTLL